MDAARSLFFSDNQLIYQVIHSVKKVAEMSENDYLFSKKIIGRTRHA